MNPMTSGTPANEPMTIDRLYALPPDLQQQILAFAEFVELRAKSNLAATDQSPTDLTTGARRQGFGLWKGAISVHDDFDEPLADFEEYIFMRLLIDTHALIWYMQGDSSLSNLAMNAIERKDNDVFVSIVSLWEIAIKLGLNKLDFRRPFENLEVDLHRLDIRILPITFADISIYRSLPLHHRDPFDRILIAQSIGNSLTIVTCDILFEPYSVRVMW